MEHPSRRAVAALFAAWILAASTTAWAQDAGGIAAPQTTPGETQEYPTAYIDRPLTLPALMSEASLRAAYWWVDEDEDVSTTTVRASFGVTDWWQASAWTRWYVEPDRAWGQTVGIATRVLALDTARVDAAPGLSAPLVFDGDRDTQPVPRLTIDGNARIRIFRRSAVYLGHDLVTLGFGDAAFTSIDLRAGYVIQMNDHLALQIWTYLFHIRVAGDIPESSGPSVPGATWFLSPVSWLDVWLGAHAASGAESISIGVAARL